MNNNIRLTSQWSKEGINFLDVNIYHQNDKLETKVFFKHMDHNSYFPIQSEHHPLWLKNIPKCQIIRVKRNCSTADNFISQSKILKDRFGAKGYNPQFLHRIMEEVMTLPSENCPNKVVPSRPNNGQEWGFISG